MIAIKLKTVEISGESQQLFKVFLSNSLQKKILNRQSSNQLPFLAGASQGSILEPMLFLIYMNDLPESFGSVVKLLAEDKSVFSNYLIKIIEQTLCGKRFLIKIQLTSRVIYFLKKPNKIYYPTIYSNDAPVAHTNCQNYLAIPL